MLVLQGDITQLRFVDSMMVVIILLILDSLRKGVRKGEEFKASRYASAVTTHDYITIYNIIPNTGNSSFVVAIYIQILLDQYTKYQSSLLYYCHCNISLAVPKFASCDGLYKYLQTEAYRLLFNKNTKLKRRRKRRKNGCLIKAAKALVVSKPIAIFYSGDRKS